MRDEICERCHCCSVIYESAPCWQCGGFEPDPEDEWAEDYCSVCESEGEVYFASCLGGCDENGKHKPKTLTT